MAEANLNNSKLKAQKVLKQYFGYDSFRPQQAEIIETVLKGRDALVLMPTGGGKSVCFQVPALVKEGIALVVSPLIALMKDQVEGLKANGVPAAFLNSSQNDNEQLRVFEAMRTRELKLLYISPEKLLTQQFLSFLQSLQISLIAIDEAHCISAWGHDFRPEYTQLMQLKRLFPQVPVIALTATADKLTRRDIEQQLLLHKPRRFIASFDRPNLSLHVIQGRKRLDSILRFIELRPQTSGIIYCLSRKGTESLASSLQEKGIPAAFYHAGLSANARSRVQQDFINDKVPIICATIAFGMGIDKSNVRWVIHYNMPKNIEGYYQEIGRAGRDSLPSDTLMFYNFGDVIKLRSFAQESGQPELQLAKLDRMQQYAEAKICRRRVLLAYFGEDLGRDCGNCDVCKNPPKYVDGTIIAQKALSAIYRMQEEVPIGTVIDVLRASGKKEILEKGYDKIKTYGAGVEIPFNDWQSYLMQMLNAGLIDIAYDEGNALKLTAASKEVLFNKRDVQLYQPQKAKTPVEAASKPRSRRMELIEGLFEQLRELRKNLAARAGIPPYLVFSDATLQEMSAERPTTELAMRDISGVGDAKLRQYGHIFIEEIISYILEERAKGANIKGSTQLLTFEMLRQGESLQDIARKRGLSAASLYTHLVYLFEQGYPIDLYRYINEEEAHAVEQAIYQSSSDNLTDLYELLEGQIQYDKIRLGVAIWNGKQREMKKS